MRRVVAVFTFISMVVLVASCKKDPANTKNQTVASIDTGSNMIGAAPVAAMFTDTAIHTSFTPSQSLSLTSQHDLVISGLSFTAISLLACNNITIKNCMIGQNTAGGIILNQCSNIRIDSCYIYSVSTGVYAADCQTISVTNCQAKNMIGPFPKGQFVQFKNVSEGSGNRICFNKIENILGESYTEDAISVFQSNGLASDPILVESNWIRGGGPSSSGGGIMLGDQGGSYEVAKNNFLVDPGQYGMAVSGGSDMAIVNNTIYAKSQSFTAEGLYYLNYTSSPSALTSRLRKTLGNFTNSRGPVGEYLSRAQQAPHRQDGDSNIYDTSLSESLLPGSIVSRSIFP